MIKRTVEISQDAFHLSLEMEQLCLNKAGKTFSKIPCEDIGIVIVDNPETTYSHNALTKIVENGAIVVVCGQNHHPIGMLLPLGNHAEGTSRLNIQINAKKSTKKRLWRQIVRTKIFNQSTNLVKNSPTERRLKAMLAEVKLNDSTNLEAQAAKLYWAEWLGDRKFSRNFNEKFGINALLNYGYIVLRAAVSRAIVSSGLNPAIGIHHCNRSNYFCLADDLLEPLRPMVDFVVRDLYRNNEMEINKTTKMKLLELLTKTIRVGDTTGPLMVSLHKVTASLVECYQDSTKKLLLPHGH